MEIGDCLGHQMGGWMRIHTVDTAYFSGCTKAIVLWLLFSLRFEQHVELKH